MQKCKKLIAVVAALVMLFAISAASLTASAVTKSEVLETTYMIDQILFGDEENNGFTFVYFDKADNTIKDMVYLPIGESPWNPGLDMFTGPTAEDECEGYEYIIFNYTYGVPTVHPSMNGRTGCAFTAPYTGTVKVMTYFRCGSVLPDASELFIYKNEVKDENLLFRQVGTEDGATSEYEVTVDVTVGDKIYWFVDAMETTANDSCDFNPRVQYIEVNDANVSDDPETEPPTSSENDTTETPDTDANDVTTDKNDDTTNAPDSGADTIAAPVTTGSSSSTDGGNNTLVIVLCVAAAVIVIAVVVVVVLKKKKK